MIRIYLPGMNVPEWIQKVKVSNGRYRLIFGNVVLCYRYKAETHVHAIAFYAPLLRYIPDPRFPPDCAWFTGSNTVFHGEPLIMRPFSWLKRQLLF